MAKPSALGRRLRHARKLARLPGGEKLSGRELSELAKLSAAAVGHVESGLVQSPTAATVVSLARVLGVSVEWLMTGVGPEPDAPAVRQAVGAARTLRGPRRAAEPAPSTPAEAAS